MLRGDNNGSFLKDCDCGYAFPQKIVMYITILKLGSNSYSPPLSLISGNPALRKNTRFPWGTLQSPREQKPLAVGTSDCSFSHRTRKASTALHRTKKIGLYLRGVSHLSAAYNNSIQIAGNNLSLIGKFLRAEAERGDSCGNKGFRWDE